MSSFLPPEIITNILSRLAVKPLLRFRCVSKPWCSLIDSSDFVKMHLNQSMKSKSNRNIFLGFENFSAHSVELRSLDSPGVDSIDSTQRLKHPFSDSFVMNFCNGLSMCYDVKDTLHYIWNPFTRKYKQLPPIPFASKNPPFFNLLLQGLPANTEIRSLEEYRYGFSYVSETDEYKVVLVKEDRGYDWTYFGNEAYIFSSRSNQWERLEPFPYQLSSTREWGRYDSCKRVWGAHLNGSLHTVVEGGSLQWELMVFDTSSKQHSRLLKPEFASRYVDVTVEVFEGNLCLLHKHAVSPMDIHMDIWVMKDYGVEDSWFKLLSVALDPDSIMTVYPLAYSEDGAEILMNLNREELVWYNLRSKSARRVTVNVLPLDFYAEVSFETLVSLPDFISKDDGKGKKSQDSDDVNKPSQQKMLKEKGNTSLTKGFLSQGFKLRL